MSIAQNISILGNGVNLACAFKSFNFSAESEALDSTTLCVSSKTYEQGQQMGTASASGVWKYDQSLSNEIHNILSDAFANSNEVVLTASARTLTFGEMAVLINGIVAKYGIEIPNGQLIMANADFQANGGIQFGKWYIGEEISTATNTASIDNATSSTNGGVIHFHGQLLDATLVNVSFQHSTNNSTWVTLSDIEIDMSYQGVSATIAAGTTVNRYTRFSLNPNGRATVYGAFARK